MQSNVDPPLGSAAKGSGMEESLELYETEGTNERDKEMSVCAYQEDNEEEEDKKLDLVLGELVKIMNMLDKGYGASKG